MLEADQLHRFIFHDAHVRGETVSLNDSLTTMLSNADYPVAIKTLLGEMAAAAALLSATLKFEGDIGLQIQGKGPVSYAVVSATHKLTYRGIARWEQDDSALPEDFAALCANSVLVITLTPDEGERYQGVVALDKPTLAQCIEAYFEQSEQLLTRVYLFTDMQQTAKASGLLLQVLPQSSEASTTEDTHMFEHLSTLADTLSAEEVFTLPVQTVLHRLYHEQDIELFDAQTVSFACTCSKERSAAALQHIDKQELLAIIAEQGVITMNCQYCHAEYQFDAIDVEAIHAGSLGEVGQPRH